LRKRGKEEKVAKTSEELRKEYEEERAKLEGQLAEALDRLAKLEKELFLGEPERKAEEVQKTKAKLEALKAKEARLADLQRQIAEAKEAERKARDREARRKAPKLFREWAKAEDALKRQTHELWTAVSGFLERRKELKRKLAEAYNAYMDNLRQISELPPDGLREDPRIKEMEEREAKALGVGIPRGRAPRHVSLWRELEKWYRDNRIMMRGELS